MFTTETGSVWIYSLQGGSYVLYGSGGNGQGYLLSSSTWFGVKVAVGQTAATSYGGYNTIVVSTLVGGPGNLAYIYTLGSSGGSWALMQTLSLLAYSGYNFGFAAQTLVMSNIQDINVNFGSNNNQGSVYTYDWDPAQAIFAAVQLPVYYNASAQSPDSLSIGLAIGDSNNFVAAASSPTLGGLGTNGGGLYVFSRSSTSAQFNLGAYIPTLTAYSYYTPFLAMTTKPNPQILVGGSDLEEVYKARWFNYTHPPLPTASPTLTPTAALTRAPTYQPTTFTEGVIYKCNNPAAAPTITAPLQQAFGLVHHYLQNTTLAEFAQPSADAAFVSSVYCITNGPYSVSLHATITSKFATGKDIMPKRRLTPLLPELRHNEQGQWESESLTETSASGVEVRYTFTFLFPAPSGNGGQVGSVAYQNMNLYFNQLKGLIINNTLNGEFDIALDHVYTTNGFPTTYSYPAPNVTGPFYIGPATQSPVPTTVSAQGTTGAGVLGGKLGLIVGLVTGVLCLALLLLLFFLLYLKRKRQREKEMEQWMRSATNADINVFKERTSSMEGDNPMSEGGLMALLPQVFFNRAVTSMHNSVRRLSTRLSVLVGAGAAGGGGSQAGGSALNSPRSDGDGGDGGGGGNDDPYKHAYDNPALALESARGHNGEQSDDEEEEEEDDYYYNDDGHNYEGERKYDEYNNNNNNNNNNAGAVYRTRIKYGPSSDSGDDDDNYDNDDNYEISSNEISPRSE